MPSDTSEKSLSESILSILSGSATSSAKKKQKKDNDDDDNKNDEKNDEQLSVKKLRKLVLLSLQLDDDNDKKVKKAFKKAVQALESEGKVVLQPNGDIFLANNNKSKTTDKKKKKEKKKDKKKKRSAEHESDNDDENNKNDATDPSTSPPTKRVKTDDGDNVDNAATSSSNDINNNNNSKRNKPCPGNPSGITRLFLGNLPFAVDEAGLKDFLPGVTHIKWITDKETGRFYGSAFVEMDTSTSAAAALAKTGQELMGRPIKVNYAPARPGDVWPPQQNTGSSAGGTGKSSGGQAGGVGIKALGEKPPDCVKLFIGNLSYDIDDDGITKFFASVDAEIKAVRWLHHKDSGDFKGCGFVEFWNTEACEKGAALNGKNLLGRPIRIDWSD